MTALNVLMIRAWVALTVTPRHDDRGDVPGWVLITVMTAGLVAIIYGVAKDELREMLRSALNKVS
ncbi:hypothetical protein GCM10009623_08340 [Nocardioides aestuarii]|uniref:DUF4244 domain-containing protein n=1 Tax=Nocardioides aestuarii TaxID=252231 RepID=A0ABW4THU2_9ACTN